MSNYDSVKKAKIEELWAKAEIKPARAKEANEHCKRIIDNKARYEVVSKATSVPWYAIGLIHTMESDCDFKTHLHNGDPLKARTVQVPAGRPLKGNPPFTWEESAIDALQYDELAGVTDWSVPHLLYLAEKFNGFGFERRGLLSAYIWAATTVETKGKYVKDGVWDANAMSDQIGCAAMLKLLIAQGQVNGSPTLPPVVDTPSDTKVAKWIINSADASDVRGYSKAGKCIAYLDTGLNLDTLIKSMAVYDPMAKYSLSIGALSPKPPVIVKPTPVPVPVPTKAKEITHSWKNGGDNSAAPTVTVLANGNYLIKSDGDTDADGSLRVGSIDPVSGQSETSLRKSNGWKGANANCDSEYIPFFVLPLNWTKVTGDSKSSLGDIAKLTYKDKTIYAIYADQGPTTLIGEASICAIEKLGGNPWNADKTKIVRGIPFGVTYEVISGSANLSRTIDFDSIQAYGMELFKSMPPVPTPGPVPGPTPASTNSKKFVEYFKANYLEVDKEVERWFAGKYSEDGTKNACVAHVVSCLKLANFPYPTLGSMGSINVDYFVDWALMNKWSRITDVTKLLPGDICVSGPSDTDIDHVYCFVEYIDKDNANVLHNQCVGIGKRSLAGVGCGKWRFAVRMPNGAIPTPTPLKDFSATFTHLKDVKNDIVLTEASSTALWNALQAQIQDKAAFNTRVNLGVKPEYGNAQCATTTASVLEGAAIKAGLPNVAELFSKPHRDKDEFALTHQIEIMLKRLGFVMYAKATHVAPMGAIAMMTNRYDFAGCEQHSGHVYSLYIDKGVGQKDIICDNGGWNHVYVNDTESFFVPSGVIVNKR